MKTSALKNVNYIGWIIIVLVFVFIYASYFFILIPRKEAQLQQKGFRILKEYGSNMLNKYNYFENHFQHYGSFYAVRWLENRNEIAKKTNIESKLEEDLKSFIAGLQAFVFTDTVKHDSNFIYDELDKNLILSFQNTEISEQNSDLRNIVKNYRSNIPSISLESLSKWNYTHYLPIENFMENLKFDRLFNNIVLFDEDFVFYNSKGGSLTEITNPGALSDSTQVQQGGVFKTLNIMGEQKHALIFPVDLPGKRFYIAGFITDIDYKNKTRSINKQLLILIAGIILLVIIGMPILKIIFIDKNERLITRDASASGISLLFGIGLFIILVTATAKRHFIDASNQKERIEDISNTLYSNVSADLNSIKNLGEIIVKNQSPNDSTIPSKVLEKFNESSGLYRDTNLAYPFPLNEIILLDQNGTVRKGYTRTPFPELVEVNLSQRQYFQNIKNLNQSWHGKNDLNFYLESIKSFNTGKGETAISFYTEKFDSLNVLTITAVIPSLYNQVLPRDVEFVIINKTGKVLYHSIEEKNLHENFVLECESDYKLVNAMNREETKTFPVYYNERKWLARIVPVENTPLFHITLLSLNQADNSNARIFLFTFYFLIATLIFIIVGLLVIKSFTLTNTSSNKNIWFLNWIVLQPSKQYRYNILSIILIFIIALQLLGLRYIPHPVTLLFYQFTFIIYSLFLSMIFLKRDNPGSNNNFIKEYLVEVNILAVVFILSVLYLIFVNAWYRIIPIVSLLFTTIIIIGFAQKIYDYTDSAIQKRQISLPAAKHFYLIFLFLWLTSITGIPTVVNYFSIKHYEAEIRINEIEKQIAEDNVELNLSATNTEDEWKKRIQGNGLEELVVEHISKINNFPEKETIPEKSISEEIYASLPDPITLWYNQPKLASQRNHISKMVKGNTLFYKIGTEKGAVKVSEYQPAMVYPRIKHTILILFVFIIIATCVWFLLKYLAQVLLNLSQENPNLPNVQWLNLLRNNKQNRILLHTFDGNFYLNKTTEWLNTDKNKKIELVSAPAFFEPGFDTASILKNRNKIIWIKGLSQCIYDFDNHEKLLAIFNEFTLKHDGLIIIDLPFNFDLIKDFYTEYASSNLTDSEKHALIFTLQMKWKTLFDKYIIYNGFIKQDNAPGIKNIREEDKFREDNNQEDLQVQFRNIWSNLSSNEKILLYDLADDGLLNRKNTVMIQRLVDKRLIVENPYPALFSDEFKDFVLHNIKPDEVKAIEHKLGVKGSWHNTKYIILMIVFPLAALIVISQGISLEKAFTILGGGLAVLTGIIRLFDSGLFKSGSS